MAGGLQVMQRSKVGQKLSDLTTSRVVLLVLVILFVTPAYNIGSGIYGSNPALGSAGVKVQYSHLHLSLHTLYE